MAVRPALRMLQISKHFPGVKALSSVDLSVRFGTIHAIIGENGAGKSTLMKILSGSINPSSGVIEINGAEVLMRNQADAQKLGIRMVYQELNLVPDLTVAENVFLGRMPKKFGIVDRPRMVRDTVRILKELGANIDPNSSLSDLTISQQQLIEIAKSYAARPQIIVLDEPTSSLSQHESEILFNVLRRLRAADIAIIYISHRLQEVIDIADEVTVLRDGVLIKSCPIADITSTEMIRLMVGREVTDLFPKADASIGALVLEIENLSDGENFSGVCLNVSAGEIVGLTGLVGAGRSEVARTIFGLSRRVAGTIKVNGELVSPRSPAEAVKVGIGYVPEDRKSDGIVPQMSVRENITLPIIRALAQLAWVRSGDERELVRGYVKQFGILPADPERRISTLSGGNQQKAILARWLATNPAILILDEPTRGVDVAAKAEIHSIIGKMVAGGMAVLMISSEMAEVLAVCDRVVVMHEGRARSALTRGQLSEEKIMSIAAGEDLQ